MLITSLYHITNTSLFLLLSLLPSTSYRAIKSAFALLVRVVYLSLLGEEKETKEVLQWAKKWAKQGPVMILGDFNTGAVINRRLVEALRVEVGLIDKGAGNRGASTTKRGTRIDRLLVADQVSTRFTAPLPLKDMTSGSYHYPCVFRVE